MKKSATPDWINMLDDASQQRLILAIDTSCDDTSVSVTRGNRVLSNVIASQTELHRQYGGVFPTVAKLAHRDAIAPSIRAALRSARVDASDVSAVAVTIGPGLAPALEVGIAAAKSWAVEHDVPVIGVNHIEGHVLSVLARGTSRKAKTHESLKDKDLLPALALIVSGGHTQLIYISALGDYQIIGSTLDDAAGECLDKIGRMINLGYPAGSLIEQLAKRGNPEIVPFPLPLTQVKTFDFSFSGLKTFARNYLHSLPESERLRPAFVHDFAASTQYAVIRHIIYKTERAVLAHPEIKSVWLGGGVAANLSLRSALRSMLRKIDRVKPPQNTQKRKLLVPYTKKLCADNAAMIGIAGALQAAQDGTAKMSAQKLERIPRLKIGSE